MQRFWERVRWYGMRKQNRNLKKEKELYGSFFIYDPVYIRSKIFQQLYP
jgi:hypothetical protein